MTTTTKGAPTMPDRYAMACPCECHGSSRPCNYAGGCGHLHRDIDHAPARGGVSTGPIQWERLTTPDGHPACLGCRRPTTPDAAFLCGTCTGVLGDALDSVPTLVEELDTARTKQDRIGHGHGRGGTGRGNDEQPLGYRPAALEATDRLARVLTWWTCEYAAAFGRVGAPRDTPAGCAAWLASVLDEVRHRESAVDLLDQVRAAVRIAWRVVDRPEPRTYAGPCDECGHDLYGYTTATRLRCTECGQSYLAADRRAWVLDALREHLATAAEIAAGIGELYGQTMTRKRINQWHSRGRLSEHGRTLPGGVPMFRIGDVLELAAAHASRCPQRAS